MIVVTFSKQKIVSINAAEMKYEARDGTIMTIDFKICRLNWLKYAEAALGITDFTEAQSTCVGQRDVFAKPPYIEFFSEPHVKVEFKSALFGESAFHQCRYLESELYKVGCATADMN